MSLISKFFLLFAGLPSVFCSWPVVAQAGGGGGGDGSSAGGPTAFPVVNTTPPNDCWPQGNPALVTKIDCAKRNPRLTAVPSLAPYVNLTDLNLRDNELRTVAGLSALKKLQNLNLELNLSLNNIGKLNGLTQLKSVKLGNNELTDIGDLSRLTNLEHLDLEQNRLNNIGNLSGLIKLSYIYVGGGNSIGCASLPPKFRATGGCR